MAYMSVRNKHAFIKQYLQLLNAFVRKEQRYPHTPELSQLLMLAQKRSFLPAEMCRDFMQRKTIDNFLRRDHAQIISTIQASFPHINRTLKRHEKFYGIPVDPNVKVYPLAKGVVEPEPDKELDAWIKEGTEPLTIDQQIQALVKRATQPLTERVAQLEAIITSLIHVVDNLSDASIHVSMPVNLRNYSHTHEKPMTHSTQLTGAALPVTQPRHRPIRIFIYGLLPDQQQRVNHKFPDVEFTHVDEKATSFKNMLPRMDFAIGMVKFIPHSAERIMKDALGDKYKPCPRKAGLTSLYLIINQCINEHLGIK